MLCSQNTGLVVVTCSLGGRAFSYPGPVIFWPILVPMMRRAPLSRSLLPLPLFIYTVLHMTARACFVLFSLAGFLLILDIVNLSEVAGMKKISVCVVERGSNGPELHMRTEGELKVN